MLNRLILKVTKFQLPPPKSLGTVVKNILGGYHALPPCQIGLKKKYAVLLRKIQSNHFNNCPSQKTIIRNSQSLFFYIFAEILSNGPFRLCIKLDKPGLCFLKLKALVELQNF